MTPAPGTSMSEGGALCFHCLKLPAASICEGCGCYLCLVCQADWFGQNFCLDCIHANREVRAAPAFQSRATIHDNVALMLMVIPIIIIPLYGLFFAMLIAPVSLFLLARYRRASRGIVPRGAARRIAAGVLAVFLLAGGATLFGAALWGIVSLDDVVPRTDISPPNFEETETGEAE
ncbi:MAG: hypothetical protein ACR2OZ_18165 [Verrucomicrobiales bacterium]